MTSPNYSHHQWSLFRGPLCCARSLAHVHRWCAGPAFELQPLQSQDVILIESFADSVMSGSPPLQASLPRQAWHHTKRLLSAPFQIGKKPTPAFLPFGGVMLGNTSAMQRIAACSRNEAADAEARASEGAWRHLLGQCGAAGWDGKYRHVVRTGCQTVTHYARCAANMSLGGTSIVRPWISGHVHGCSKRSSCCKRCCPAWVVLERLQLCV